MAPYLKVLTPLGTRFEDVRLACSACGKEFRYAPAYGSGSIRAAGSYLKTRFAKHVARYHPKEAA